MTPPLQNIAIYLRHTAMWTLFLCYCVDRFVIFKQNAYICYLDGLRVLNCPQAMCD